MEGLTLLKDLSVGSPNILQLLKQYVFGNSDINLYNTTTIYHKGDISVVNINNKLYIKQAINDTSGDYKSNDWTTPNLSIDTMTKAANTVIVSIDEPETDDNVLWLKPIKLKTIEIPENEWNNAVSLQFDNEEFPVVDETVPSNMETGLYFDSENEYNDESDFTDDCVTELESQDDVVISDDQPNEDVPLWIDTDITN